MIDAYAHATQALRHTALRLGAGLVVALAIGVALQLLRAAAGDANPPPVLARALRPP